jgi:hypothetical protein
VLDTDDSRGLSCTELRVGFKKLVLRFVKRVLYIYMYIEIQIRSVWSPYPSARPAMWKAQPEPLMSDAQTCKSL